MSRGLTLMARQGRDIWRSTYLPIMRFMLVARSEPGTWRFTYLLSHAVHSVVSHDPRTVQIRRLAESETFEPFGGLDDDGSL